MDSGPVVNIPAEKIKWYPGQAAIDTPMPVLTPLYEYRDKLLGMCLQQLAEAAEANVKDADEIYKAIGRTLLKELMK